MAYSTPKEVLTALLAGLRAHTWPASIGTIVFRKGPQRSLVLAPGTDAAVIVACDEMPSGEESAALGNNWWETVALKCVLLVPDDETEASEDARLDLFESFCEYIHANRTITGTAKVCRIASAKWQVGTLFENTKQFFRAVDVTVTYKSLRS